MGIRVREEAPYSYRDFNKHERKYVIKIEKKGIKIHAGRATLLTLLKEAAG